MSFYPQLSSGALTQMPFRRAVSTRTIMNQLPDGSMIKMADSDAGEITWELRYTGLSDEERTAIEQFFLSRDGRLHEFTFVDPAGNALRWSENASSGVWRLDGALTATTTDQDHDGARVLQVTNTGQITQGLEQGVTAPGGLVWCFSANLKSAAATSVRCRLLGDGRSIESVWTAGVDWMQIWCSGSIASGSDEIRVRIDLEAGASVQLCALQLEAQPLPGAYRRTAAANGVFPATRFDSDQLHFEAHGDNNHSTVVRLRSRTGAL